jgi:hypothetical protein
VRRIGTEPVYDNSGKTHANVAAWIAEYEAWQKRREQAP